MTAGGGFVLRQERAFPAPPAAVFRALTDPGQLGKWWGPRGFTAPSVDFDPRVGRGYRIVMRPPAGETFQLSGEFRNVDPPALLVYTFRWTPPAADDRETVVSLALDERGDETLVRLVHGEFATEERLALHDTGWRESFERLEQLLRGGAE